MMNVPIKLAPELCCSRHSSTEWKGNKECSYLHNHRTFCYCKKPGAEYLYQLNISAM